MKPEEIKNNILDLTEKINNIDPENITGKYILKKGVPVEEFDLMAWARWFEKNDRRVIYDKCPEYYISTVFLALDHGWRIDKRDKPVLYETMVFGGPNDQYQARYHTKQEAKRGHRKVRRLLRKSRML